MKYTFLESFGICYNIELGQNEKCACAYVHVCAVCIIAQPTADMQSGSDGNFKPSTYPSTSSMFSMQVLIAFEHKSILEKALCRNLITMMQLSEIEKHKHGHNELQSKAGRCWQRDDLVTLILMLRNGF